MMGANHSILANAARRRPIIAAGAALLICIILLYTFVTPSTYSRDAQDVLQALGHDAKPFSHDAPFPNEGLVDEFEDTTAKLKPFTWERPTLESVQSKYAYVTLLAVDKSRDDHDSIGNDEHFIALRMLAYQLLHASQTKSHGIPFIILASEGASESKKERLRRDGALVIDVAPISMPDWIPESYNPAWANMFDKLRAWEFTQFDRMVFLDADVVLTKPLDGAFESATLQKSKDVSDVENMPTAPSEYVFTAGIEPNVAHNFPPTLEQGDFERGLYVNAGFFVMKPSLEMFEYYNQILQIPNSFKTEFREQDLLNFVHRLTGEMPWEQLNPIWNMHYGMQSDIDGGTHSVHVKWWNPHHHDLLPFLHSWRWRMEGYFDMWDEMMMGSGG